ncbi:hypothetical protein AKJ16_DCAP06110 [Drosera capensis]
MEDHIHQLLKPLNCAAVKEEMSRQGNKMDNDIPSTPPSSNGVSEQPPESIGIIQIGSQQLVEKYKWNPENTQAVFNEFEHKCMKHLTDTTNKAVKRLADQLPKWSSPEIPGLRKGPLPVKQTGEKLGEGVGTHYQGSMSTAELVKKMTKELGRVPTLSVVYLRSKSKKKSKDTDEVLFINDRCSQAWFQEFKTLQEKAEGSQDGQHSPASESELFLKAIGGFLPSGTLLDWVLQSSSFMRNQQEPEPTATSDGLGTRELS